MKKFEIEKAVVCMNIQVQNETTQCEASLENTMKIVCVVENTSSRKDLSSKHGICFYIKTKKHRLLFDLGPDELFLKNA